MGLKYLRLFSFLFIGLLAYAEADAQTIPMIQYTIENGLPSNNVYNVYRDKKGFLWFATDKGVARHNGVTFEQYTVADGLPDNEIFLFREDYEGRMWMQTYNGKLCYYKDGKFYSEKNTPFLKLTFQTMNTSGIDIGLDKSIVFLFMDRSWFVNITDNRVKSYNIRELEKKFGELENVKKINSNQLLLQYRTIQVYIDTLGKITGTKNYKKKGAFIRYTANDEIYLLNGDSIYNWNEQALYQLPEQLRNELPNPGSLIEAFYDQSRQMYCTRNGLYMSTGEHLLEGKTVTGAYTDINGDYWVTTIRYGAYYFSKKLGRIIRYENVCNGRFISPYSDRGKFYFSSSVDVNLYSFYNGQTKLLFKNNAPPDVSDESRHLAYTVKNNGDIYLQTDSKELYYLSGNTPHHCPVTGRLLKCRFLFSNGPRLYGLNSYGIGYFVLDSLKTNAYTNWHMILNDSLHAKRIIARSMDKYGDMWYCMQDGVYRITGARNVIQRQFGTAIFRKILFNEDYMIAYDADNILYIYRLYPDHTKLIRTFHDNKYFWGEIFAAGKDRVIISTNTYYQLLTLRDDSVRCYMQALEDPFIPQNAFYIYTDSLSCYFAKDGAITQIPVSYLFKNTYAPTVMFTRLRVRDKVYDVANEIVLPSHQSKNISIGFEGISFNSREINYQYSLSESESDDNWTDIDGTTINLSSPGYTTYYVKLRAKGLSGNYSNPVKFVLTIERPFWLNWWFVSLIVLMALAGIIIITRAIVVMILRRRRRMHELESRYYTAEYKTLNALMNPHFIFNSLNNIKGLVNKDDKKGANKFLTNFSSVIRQNMQNLSKETVSLAEEIALVSKYLELEKLRFGPYINYTLHLSPEVSLQEVHIPPLLIQPLVENAVKHGLLPRLSPDNMITINVYSRAQSVFIEVRDNGIGFNKGTSSEHDGFDSLGLQNIEKRISYLRQSGKQQIFFSIRELIEADTGTGTIAIIEIVY